MLLVRILLIFATLITPSKSNAILDNLKRWFKTQYVITSGQYVKDISQRISEQNGNTHIRRMKTLYESQKKKEQGDKQLLRKYDFENIEMPTQPLGHTRRLTADFTRHRTTNRAKLLIDYEIINQAEEPSKDFSLSDYVQVIKPSESSNCLPKETMMAVSAYQTSSKLPNKKPWQGLKSFRLLTQQHPEFMRAYRQSLIELPPNKPPVFKQTTSFKKQLQDTKVNQSLATFEVISSPSK